MSATTPNFNTFIDRIDEILRNSSLILPKTLGDTSKIDLVNQIIKYEIPIADNPPAGLGPPHIFISLSPNAVSQRAQRGRSTVDVQGGETLTLEFYIVIVAQDPSDVLRTQKQLYDIVEAVTTTLAKNLRMLDKANANPLCYTLEYVVVPYLLESTEVTVVAKNVILRPQVYVNLR